MAGCSMTRRYSGAMRARQTLPAIWLVSDRRNDAVLETALARLPRRSGLVFRHHHLAPPQRARRFAELRRVCRRHGHLAILAGPATMALRLGAEGCYGSPRQLGRRAGGIRLVTAHSLREIAQAARAGANAVLLSPAFPTRSHPGTPSLGPLRFLLLASRSPLPVIALGGMTPRAARRLRVPRWAAIDGLSTGRTDSRGFLTRIPRPAHNKAIGLEGR